jgi:hypothetical protein
MSSTYSAASAASPLASNEPECEPSRSARSTPTPGQSSPSIGPPFHATKTLEPLTQIGLPLTGSGLMSSVGASHARTSATQEREQDSPGSVPAYGLKSPAWLANFDRDTSLWKTSQHCLVEGLATYSETWPRSGTMRSGTAYQLPTLVPLTVETESGSWPTPTSRDHKGAYSAASQLLKPRNLLPDAVRRFPTPKARDHQGVSQRSIHAPGDALPNMVAYLEGSTTAAEIRSNGRLNPTWVEWLMGFPLTWTALDASEMPSSRKSPKSSGGQ